MKHLLVLVMLTSFHLNLPAQEKYMKDIPETQQLSKEVSRLFATHKISESFDLLSAYWPLPENEIEGLEEKTIKYLNIIDERFGRSIDMVKVKNETIADVAIRETYLVRYENTAIRLIFTYYRNNNGWIVNAFKWDDSFTEEFQ